MKHLLKVYLRQSPLLIFLPFLVLFVGLILRLHTDAMTGDEGRYFQFAKNLTQGFYSPPPPAINLWNGPGYPLVLVPFVALGLPLISITLANAVFQYFSIVLLFKSLLEITNRSAALVFSMFWAGYYIAYQELPSILTEPFTNFLSSLIIFLFVKAFKTGDIFNKFSVAAGLAFGFLVLTKIIFGYVLLVLLLLFFVNFLLKKSIENRKALSILAIAFCVNFPYLVYTFHLTDRFFYWGNSGGMSLYWMSTPVEGEFGEWNDTTFTVNCLDIGTPCNAHLFAKNHQKDMDFIKNFEGVARDEAFKKLAFDNIRAHPVKYLRNCIANVGRLFFGFPNSYIYQREQTLLRLPPNCILLTLIFFCSIPTVFYFRKLLPIQLKLLLAIVFLYLFFSALVSAYPRQLYVVVPIFFILVCFCF